MSAAPASGGTAPVPQAGNWEGSGAHGLPMSFGLAWRHGRLVATAIAVGAPLTCPATERDAEVVPLSDVAYTGPGASAQAGSSATLSGKVPGRGERAQVTGEFTSSATGTFSIHVKGRVGCGWPSGTLTWQVRRARRKHVADGIRTAMLTGPNILSGDVRVRVAAGGRVVQSFHTDFACQTDSSQGENRLTVSPAYEFIRPGGRFYSPLKSNAIRRHPTTWVGELSRTGSLRGALRIYESCTRQLITAHFQTTNGS